MTWGNQKEKQTRLRIFLSVCAYAYEVENFSIIDDDVFDILSKLIDKQMTTGNKMLDKFFKYEFDSSTGQWIHSHPELDNIVSIYEKHYKDKKISKEKILNIYGSIEGKEQTTTTNTLDDFFN